MKKIVTYLLTVFLVSVSFFVDGQTINHAEYFIDKDPGTGNGKALSIQSGDSISTFFNIAITRLSNGFHQLFIRTEDVNNNWSIAEQRTFYIDSSLNVITPLTAVEYFIDVDPGIGKGKSLNIQGSDTISTLFNIAVNGLAGGFHQLYIRTKNQNNNWSIAEQRTFYIDSNLSVAPSPIIAGEYYINIDSAGIGNNTPVSIKKGYFVDTGYSYIAANLPYGKYTMNLRVEDSIGNWSFVESRSFTVCSSYGAKSDFNFAVSDSSVSLINNSVYASSYHWNFGDGDTSNLFSPYHRYVPGIYNACLISKNDCLPNGDTLCKTVEVDGLAAINTNHGGNTGTVSVSVTGAGFTPGMQVYLHKNGQQDIYGDTLIVENTSLMTTTFELTGKNIGLWDVIAVFPNGKADTLHNGFTIEAGTQPKLWVNITGDRALRIGFNQIYTVAYGNSGNTDGVMVPLLITGLPIGTDIQVLNPLFRIDSLPEFDTLHASVDSVQQTISDSTNNLSFRLFYIKKITAGSSTVVKLIFHVPGTTQLHSYANIQVILGEPQGIDSASAGFHNIQSPSSAQSKEEFNFDQFLDCVKDAADVAADLLDLEGWDKCYTIGLSTLATLTSKFVATPPPDPLCQTCSDISDAGGLIFGSFESTESCILAVTGAFCPVSKVYKWVHKTEELLSKSLTYSGAGYSCGQSAANIIKVIIGNFWDPNSKYGIGDSSSNHYTRNTPLSYVVNFENDPAANTNAPTVTVLDTLNRTYYDYSSFGFNSVSIGDSIYSFINPVKSFVHDFDFTKQYGVKARVTGTFDSASGVAQWSFYSIDPLTNQQTTNALLGFLPPDVISPEGQGYVSFTVNPDSNIQNGDAICNKASIIFYPNPPITTDCFRNVFDLIKPVSKVNSLPVKESVDTFAVSWNGSDNLSGVRDYEIFVSINDSMFIPWLDTTSTNAFYPGVYGNKYSFYSIATDNAGNIESAKTSGETATTIDTSTVLPITLLNFSSQCNKQNVLLSWQTANEINSNFFELQRSVTGINTWSDIGVVTAAGNSSNIKSYQFADRSGGGKSFYRLQQVDKDGKTYYSQIIKSNCGFAGTKVQVYPIPAKDILNIVVQTNNNGKETITLTDLYGRIIKQVYSSLQIGSNNTNFNISNIAAGEYFLKVEYPDGSNIEKIIITR